LLNETAAEEFFSTANPKFRARGSNEQFLELPAGRFGFGT